MFVGLFGATISAIVGAAIAIGFQKRSREMLSALVQIATGALLAVAVFDILPEAKAGTTWPVLIFIVLCGFLLLWLVGNKIFPVCPSCSLSHFEEELAKQDRQTILMLSTALGIHSCLDGLALAAGGVLPIATATGLLTGIILHKIPEGFALALLLIGAKMKPSSAFVLTAAVESFTLIGGSIGIAFFSRNGIGWIPTVFGIVGGGFLYLVYNNWNSTLAHDHEHKNFRWNWIWIEGATFSLVGAFLMILARVR